MKRWKQDFIYNVLVKSEKIPQSDITWVILGLGFLTESLRYKHWAGC